MIKNRFGLVSLILGILAFLPITLIVSFPIEGIIANNIAFVILVLGFVFAVLAIAFGIVGAIIDESKVMAIIGIIIGAITFVGLLFLVIIAILIPFLITLTLGAVFSAICASCAGGGT